MRLRNKIFVILISTFLLGGLVFNIQLYYEPKYVVYGNSHLNQDLIHQLKHLKEKLHNGSALEMQNIYPEGFVFLNVLYGLSWTEVAETLSEEDDLYEEAIDELNWALNEVSSENGKMVFNEFLKPSYGIFYRGWSNYLLGRKLKLLPSSKWDSSDIQNFENNCHEFIHLLNKQSSPYLESYSGACWPADMVVGMASVSIYSKLCQDKYEHEISMWLKKVDQKTDSLGLIPHSCNCRNGGVTESSRGSSQSLILNFLFEIDPEYAKDKFKIYKENFLDYRLGLPGIREYPKGESGNGDIDSGPVIWGIGGAASLVGRRVMSLYEEPDVAIGIRNSIEAFGIGKTLNGKKNYLFGKLPIADAFIAWSISIEASEENKLNTDKKWRIPIQLTSISLWLIGGWVIFSFFNKK